MKLKLLPFAAAALAIIGISNPVQAQVTVDGVRNTGEYTGAVVFNQATVSNWTDGGGQEALANIHAVQDGNALAIHLAARVYQRGIILFIDSKSGGRTFISKPLITFGGEEDTINNLGTDTVTGMTFETDFTPDYAIRIYGDGGTGAFVNTYDLTAGTRTEAGNAGVAVISSGFISQMRANSLETVGTVDSADYSAANKGVEMKLDLAALGAPFGPQSIKLMAVLVNVDSTYGSNQVLASRTSTTGDIAGAINSINFQTESNPQTISIPVTGPESRPVVFSVNMNEEIAKGFFNPVSDRVKVDFFTGLASPTPGEIYLTDEDNNKIYTGTLLATGTVSNLFGEYKFLNTRSTPNFGFEYGANRDFNLGPLNTTQALATVVFRSSYSAWSDAFSGGQPATGDNDGDGIKNGIECFMGSFNNQFTPNPGPVSGVITWPRSVDSAGIPFKVEISDNLSTWQNVATSAYSANLTITDSEVVFTLPTGVGKIFTRLNVTP